MDAPRILLGDREIPEVLKTLAALLPSCSLEDVGSQLETFDIFVPILSTRAHPELAALLISAAAQTSDVEVRAHILKKALSIHSQEPQNSRLVEQAEYDAAICGAIEDPTHCKPGGIGEVERWIAPDGRVVAWRKVLYFKGEHDYEYYVCD